MKTYEILLFGHIISVVVWMGSNVGTHVLALRAFRRGPDRTLEFMADVEWLSLRLQLPASLLVIVFGALLANDIGYGFSETWLVLALSAFGLSFLLGAGYLGPSCKRIPRLLVEKGPDHPDTQAQMRRFLLVSRIELLLLAAVVLDMVVKPKL